MSSALRPWYKWYPKDFNTDEKVQCLDWMAELIYRRLLDVMWQSNDCRLPNDVDALSNCCGFATAKDTFLVGWKQIQRKDFELFEENGNWIYSKRLKKEMKECLKLSEQRRKLGRKGGLAKGKAKAKAKGVAKLKQKGSDTDTDTDIKKKVFKEKKRTAIPPGFVLTEKLKGWALKHGMPAREIKREFLKFKTHHEKTGNLFKDWDKAWLTWVLRHPEFGPQRSKETPHPLDYFEQ